MAAGTDRKNVSRTLALPTQKARSILDARWPNTSSPNGHGLGGAAMRIWQNAHGSLITDEQLVRHIAAYGSLSRALEDGDICLVVSADPSAKPLADQPELGRRRPHAPLSTRL
jgi:hypothetical protein